jgi:hypothetical protein
VWAFVSDSTSEASVGWRFPAWQPIVFHLSFAFVPAVFANHVLVIIGASAS